MNIKNFMSSLALAAIASMAMTASAGNVDANAARSLASNYLNRHATGSLRAPSMSSLKLAHAEPSSVNAQASTYYVFNIDGGGFIIIAGEDRATQVLGYSDKGRLDFDNLPINLKEMLDSYREEIEYLQKDTKGDLVAAPQVTAGGNVGPLLTTTWGQEMPYYLQCPKQGNEYCVVGCVATAMAQVMYYWKYPTSCDALSSYGGYWGSNRVPALPATTFEYDKMLDTYCWWNWDNSELIQLEYTDEQAQAVAILSRYCGQAVEMDYSPDGSGAYTSDQYYAMINTFGYKNTANLVSKSSWWGGGYSNSEWSQMLNDEFDAGRPVLYSANDPNEGGHAFVLDGYNSEGLYHVNWGWFGTGDGYYAHTALNVLHRSGTMMHFNSGHQMIIGLEPPAHTTISAGNLDAANNLMPLGESLACEAKNVNISTTYKDINFVYALTDASDNIVAESEAVKVTISSFTQGSTINGNIALPTDLTDGTYDLKLYYYTSTPNQLTKVSTSASKLQVVGNVAKYKTQIDVSDTSTLINWLLNGTYSNIDVEDVAKVIDYLLVAPLI